MPSWPGQALALHAVFQVTDEKGDAVAGLPGGAEPVEAQGDFRHLAHGEARPAARFLADDQGHLVQRQAQTLGAGRGEDDFQGAAALALGGELDAQKQLALVEAVAQGGQMASGALHRPACGITRTGGQPFPIAADAPVDLRVDAVDGLAVAEAREPALVQRALKLLGDGQARGPVDGF